MLKHSELKTFQFKRKTSVFRLNQVLLKKNKLVYDINTLFLFLFFYAALSKLFTKAVALMEIHSLSRNLLLPMMWWRFIATISFSTHLRMSSDRCPSALLTSETGKTINAGFLCKQLLLLFK